MGEDIHEGKMSLIVIHALNHSENKDRLFEILKMKTTYQKIIDEAIEIIKASNSLEYAKNREK